MLPIHSAMIRKTPVIVPIPATPETNHPSPKQSDEESEPE